MPYCAAGHAMAIGAALQRGFRALPGEAVLHHRLTAPPRALRPNTGLLLHTSMRAMAVCGNGVPIDGVAKGFVQPHAILIDGDALRRALQRRGFEAVKAQILEHAVALDVAEADTPAAWLPSASSTVAPCWAVTWSADKALQRAGHLVGGKADVGIGQGAVDHDMLGAVAGRHLLGQAGVAKQAAAASRTRRDFHAFPFCYARGLEQGAGRRNFPNSRFWREFFPNDRLRGRSG